MIRIYSWKHSRLERNLGMAAPVLVLGSRANCIRILHIHNPLKRPITKHALAH
jgi:hypothetical protein